MTPDTPDIEDPMAWMAFATDGSESNAVYSTDGEAQAAAEAWGWKVMPLYLAPRLTDAEREAVERACCSLGGVVDMSAECTEWDADARLTLLSLLERMSGDGDCPQADNAADRDNAPTTDATPAECTVPPQWTSRPYWVDPPSGWRYGFPRLYDPAKDGDMRAWMIAAGYPERLARQDLPCTFTHCTEDVKK